ncbi:MAG: PEP/pyruvate-binding domain-containing protein [Candidatus Thermoplasmatota archaeon]
MYTRFSDKEKKIIECIRDITGITPTLKEEKTLPSEPLLVKTVLILASSYDYYQLDEEGRLSTIINEHYPHNRTIRVIHVEDKDECLRVINDNDIDLLIIFNKTEDILELTEKIKTINRDTRVVLIGNDITQLNRIYKQDRNHDIAKILTWNGDGRIILAAIQLLEDASIIERGPPRKARMLLLVEDSIQYYSTYIPLIYNEIWDFIKTIINNNPNNELYLSNRTDRPILIHAISFEEGKTISTRYTENLIGVITDYKIPSSTPYKDENGFNLAKIISKIKPVPILIQSSESIKEEHGCIGDIRFISKNNHDLIRYIRDFVNECLGPKEIEIKDKTDRTYKIRSIYDLENTILSIDEDTLIEYSKSNIFSKWLKVHGEYDLAEKINEVERRIRKGSISNKMFIDIIEEYRYAQTQLIIPGFERASKTTMEISRIGKGALGGKARGLSFLAKIISKYISNDMFPNLRILIPRSIILSTDVFEEFMTQNNLLYDTSIYDLSDERISLIFMNKNLPPTIIGDLRFFIQRTRKPLIVRSSGILEDSLLQSFAGVYDSILLSNESWETDFRFQEICNAVKYVYASTFFEKARTYIKSTSKNITDERMAVIIQEVAGRRCEDYFYPAISGVAKSYNYYPTGGCRAEDGIVYLALGLGKAIVDGGCSFCFCPEHPKTSLYGTPKDYIRYSQKRFYALNLKPIHRIVEKTEDTPYSILTLEEAKRHRVLEKIASTYIPSDDRLVPGLEEGVPVIDFAPILQHESIPLARALKMLLRVSEIALGHPVEIEFAVNLLDAEDTKAELYILQIRNMLILRGGAEIKIDDYNPDVDLCYSENALGNTIIENIKDILYVKPDFDMTNSKRVVPQIRRINKKLIDNNIPYILIGPGRWGSADPCLGIPVIWSDIAGVKVIIETPSRERVIDPSQGSHFFHDLISSQVGYITTRREKGDINYKWLESLEVIEEDVDVKHAKTPHPLIIKINGRQGKASIQLNKKNK